MALESGLRELAFKMKERGASVEQMRTAMNLYKARYTPDVPTEQQIPLAKSHETTQRRELPFSEETGRKILSAYDYTVTPAATITGGAVGFASPMPGGSLVGAGLAHSAAGQGRNLLSQYLLGESPTARDLPAQIGMDFKQGVQDEMLGQGLAKGITRAVGYGAEKIPKIARRAGKAMEEFGVSPKYSDEALEAAAKRTDSNLTVGQRGGKYKARAAEQYFAKKDVGFAEEMGLADAAAKGKAATAVQKAIPKGKLKDVLAVAHKSSKAIDDAVTVAEDAVANVYSKVGGRDPQAIGKTIRPMLQKAKGLAKKASDKLYDAIPNLPIKTEGLRTSIQGIEKDFIAQGGDAGDWPSGLVKQIENGIVNKDGEPIKSGFKKLYGFTKTAGKAKFRNRETDKGRWAGKIKNALDNALDEGMQGTSASDAYDVAKANYAKYDRTFRKGAVGDVLAYGKGAGGYRTDWGKIPKKFYAAGDLDAADALSEAIGKEQASKSITDFVDQKLLEVFDPSIKGVNQNYTAVRKFLKNNKTVLKRYGLWDKYQGVGKVTKRLSEAVGNRDEFSKTAFSKLAGEEVETAISTVIKSGSKGREVMKDIVSNIGKDKSAINGLKVGLRDFITNEMEVASRTKDVAGNVNKTISKIGGVLNKYRPAMEELYTKKQMQSFDDMREIHNAITRNKNVTQAGSSTTGDVLMGGSSIGKISKAIRALPLAGGIAGGPKGYVLMAWIRNAVSGVLKDVSQTGTDMVEAIVKKGLADPDYGMQIMKYAKKGIPLTEQGKAAKDAFRLLVGRTTSQTIPDDIGEDTIKTGLNFIQGEQP